MMENNLPKGWVECKFGEVGKIFNGYAFATKDFRTDNGVPLIKQSQLNGDRVELSKCVYLDEKFLETKKDFILKKGDVLIGMSGSVGKMCLYDLDLPALQNQRTGKVVPLSDTLLNKKLFWYFLSTIERVLLEKGKGLGVSNVSADDIEDLTFNLPPLSEQHRIVAKLDALMQKIESNKQRLEKIPKLLKRFRQSVLAAAVSGKLTEAWREKNEIVEEWEEVELNSVIPKGGIFDGPFGSNLKTVDYTDEGIRVIRLENIGHLYFVFEKETYITPEKYQTLKRHTVGAGDIIFSSFISEEIRACILPELSTLAIAKADCFCIRPDKKKIDKVFLLYSLISRRSYEQLVLNIHGATRPRINTTQLKKLPILLPSLPEQTEIVRQVEALFAFADKIEARYTKTKVMLDKLPQSLLAKAFRGELVPQNPADEPAAVLLERIKAEKALGGGEKKGRKTKKLI